MGKLWCGMTPVGVSDRRIVEDGNLILCTLSFLFPLRIQRAITFLNLFSSLGSVDAKAATILVPPCVDLSILN